LNSLKYDLSTCLKLKLNLSLGQMSPYRVKKYKEIIPYLTETKIVRALEIVLDLQQKISGVWDYSSLFLKSLLELRKLK